MDLAVTAFGPGDFSEWSDPLFQQAPAGPAVLLSFGSAPYGAALVDALRTAARERLDRVQRECRVVPALTAEDLDRPDCIDSLDGAGFVYLQGGNPSYICSV